MATNYQMDASFLSIGSYAARVLEAGFRETASCAFWYDLEPTVIFLREGF
jgi:hypothetical protein